MRRLKKYKVHITPYRKVVVHAYTEKGAKQQAWDSMAGGYKYGWLSQAEFMRKAKVVTL